MSRIARVGKAGATIGATVGVLAAGAAVGLAAERYMVGRSLKKADPHIDGPWRGESYDVDEEVVVASDGVRLITESMGDPSAKKVVIFAHGYALDRRSWWYQWRDLPAHLGPETRLVRYDQRGHGESEYEPVDSINALGEDLHAVLTHYSSDSTGNSSPAEVYLVGHSMGGMSILALARKYPELFGKVIKGVVMVSSTSGESEASPLGTPILDLPLVSNYAPQILDFLADRSELVERGMRAGKDLAFVMTKRYSFGSQVDPRLVEWVSEMIRATSIEVIADFFPLFQDFDAFEALRVLKKVPTEFFGGLADRLTPPAHTSAMGAEVPGARVHLLPKTGHLLMLERPDQVTEAIVRLVRDEA